MDILDTRENLNAMVLKHEREIQELKRLVTPMMEFKREKLLQEPVAWLVTYAGLTHVVYTQPTQVVDTHYQPLYAAPPQRTWVGLTDEEIETLYYGNADTITGTERNFGRAVESALKEKNNE